MTTAHHPLIARYVARHDIAAALRTDGRATLVVDDNYRMHLVPARNGWLAMSSRLCTLPPEGVAREAFLETLGRQAEGMLAGHASACVIDPAADALWLQQMLRPDSTDIQLDEAVGQFANALSFWTSAVRRAA